MHTCSLNHTHNPTQIEDISNLLNTGEVPNLFDTGDTIAIGEAVRNRARAARMDGSRADLYTFFVNEVRVLVCTNWLRALCRGFAFVPLACFLSA